MATKDPRIVGPRIAKARQAADLTQVQLAEALGVSSSSVADWERGAVFPKRKLGKVEKFFGQSFDYEESTSALLGNAEAAARDILGVIDPEEEEDEDNGGRHAV